MRYKVLYSSSAKKDLKGIYEYIAYELLVPETAEEQISKIIKSVDSLEEFPYRYKLYYEEPWQSQGIRCFFVGNYMVFYSPVDETRIVKVIRIIYGKRNLNIELKNR